MAVTINYISNESTGNLVTKLTHEQAAEYVGLSWGSGIISGAIFAVIFFFFIKTTRGRERTVNANDVVEAKTNLIPLIIFIALVLMMYGIEIVTMLLNNIDLSSVL